MTPVIRLALFAFVAAWGSVGAARADVERAISAHILPEFARFAQATSALDAAAQSDCRAVHVQPVYQAAFDAWMPVADLHIGPSETGGLSIAFWPDDRGFTPRTLSDLIAGEDPVGLDPGAYAEVSIAARGFFALEMLLYDSAFFGFGSQDYTCSLVRTVTADLARQAAELERGWSEGFAETLTSAGAADNATFLSQDEALRAVYTQLLTGLEITADARLGRPMGTFERPRPRQAEAWRSGRSLRNVLLAVEAAQSLAQQLSDTDLPQTDAAIARVRRAADAISEPAFQDVEDPQARLRIEVLQQAVRSMRTAIEAEIGTPLGIAAGFNSQDGD